MAHNEDFLKTVIPEELWESAILTADGAGFEGLEFEGLECLLEYLSDDKVVIQITSTAWSNNFICKLQRLVPVPTNNK